MKVLNAAGLLNIERIEIKDDRIKVALKQFSDPASLVQKQGGIDLTEDQLNLQIKTEASLRGKPIVFKMDPAILQRLENAPGFTPVVISLEPLKSVENFMGLKSAYSE